MKKIIYFIDSLQAGGAEKSIRLCSGGQIVGSAIHSRSNRGQGIGEDRSDDQSKAHQGFRY